MVAVGITLQCFGTVLGPGFQGFLDGHTQDATLGLAPSIGDPFTGTMWSKDDSGTATTLQCLGFASDPRRFLDGHTQDATLASLRRQTLHLPEHGGRCCRFRPSHFNAWVTRLVPAFRAFSTD